MLYVNGKMLFLYIKHFICGGRPKPASLRSIGHVLANRVDVDQYKLSASKDWLSVSHISYYERVLFSINYLSMPNSHTNDVMPLRR